MIPLENDCCSDVFRIGQLSSNIHHKIDGSSWCSSIPVSYDDVIHSTQCLLFSPCKLVDTLISLIWLSFPFWSEYKILHRYFFYLLLSSFLSCIIIAYHVHEIFKITTKSSRRKKKTKRITEIKTSILGLVKKESS